MQSYRFLALWGLCGILAGLAVTFALIPTPAGASHKLTNIHKGTGATTCTSWAGDPNQMGEGWHACWHKGEGSSTKPSVDLASAAGTIVKWRQSANTQAELLLVVFRANAGCQGVMVDATTPNTGGDYPYKHVVPSIGVVNSTSQNLISLPEYFEYWRQLGTVASNEPGCPTQWKGAHLHQQLNDTSLTQVFGQASNPTSTLQMFQVVWH